MGTVTIGNLKAGSLNSGVDASTETIISFANSTAKSYSSTINPSAGHNVETFDFTESGLGPASMFVYEKAGPGKTQGYPGLCLISDGDNGSQSFIDRGPSGHKLTVANDTHHDNGGSITMHNLTSIYFDGTGDHIGIQDSEDFLFERNDFTFSVWAHATGFGSDNTFIANHDSSGNYQSFNFGFSSSRKLFFTFSDDAGDDSNALTDVIISQDTWHHCVAQRRGNTIELFVDGVFVKADRTIGNQRMLPTDVRPTIGRAGDYNGSYMQGYLDDLVVINGKAIYPKHGFLPPSSSPKDTRATGNVADYTKITLMGYKEATQSFFTAITYVAGDEVVATDFMGIPESDLNISTYTGGVQTISMTNASGGTLKFTAYVETNS